MNKLIKALLFFGVVLSAQAFAGTSSGTISVTGRVVNVPCAVSQVDHTIRFDCLKDNKLISKNINIEKTNRQYNINNDNMVMVSANYINKEKTLAIVNVTYN